MLITAPELASLLKISVGQVYRLAKIKAIPCYRLGDTVRFNATDVLAATVTTPPPVRQPKTVAQALAMARLQWRMSGRNGRMQG